MVWQVVVPGAQTFTLTNAVFTVGVVSAAGPPSMTRLSTLGGPATAIPPPPPPPPPLVVLAPPPPPPQPARHITEITTRAKSLRTGCSLSASAASGGR